VFNQEATHQAVAGLDWKQYFTQVIAGAGPFATENHLIKHQTS
jgi:hypothetical protein